MCAPWRALMHTSARETTADLLWSTLQKTLEDYSINTRISSAIAFLSYCEIKLFFLFFILAFNALWSKWSGQEKNIFQSNNRVKKKKESIILTVKSVFERETKVRPPLGSLLWRSLFHFLHGTKWPWIIFASKQWQRSFVSISIHHQLKLLSQTYINFKLRQVRPEISGWQLSWLCFSLMLD